MRNHHRNYPFRPPRKKRDRRAASLPSFLSFIRRYMGDCKLSVALCILFLGINACNPYFIAFYTQLVVDNVLVVKEYTAQGKTLDKPDQRVWARGHRQTSDSLPGAGSTQRTRKNPALSDRPPAAGSKLWGFFGLFVATLVALNLLARLAQRIRIQVGRSVASGLREDMHEKVLNLSLAYHNTHTPGRLLSRILSDVEVIQQQTMMTLVLGSRSLVMILVGATILATSELRIFLIACTVLPIYAFVFKRARSHIRDINRELRHTNSCMYGLVSQKLDGIKAIQSYGRERQEQLNFHRLAACFFRDALNQQRVSAGVGRAAQIIMVVTTCGIFLFCTQLVLDGQMTLGRMLFVHATVNTLFNPITQLTQLNIVVTHLLVVVQRVTEILDEPLEIVDAPDAVPFPSPLKRGMTARDLSFRYRPEQDDDSEFGTSASERTSQNEESPLVMDKVNVHVPSGTWTCILGPSGSGKSTLLYLLARLYEPEKGRVFYDGVPLEKIRTLSLRKSVSFVPQEAQIFSGTIRENICYAKPDASPTEIMAAAKAAELHDFIMELPVKYETLIGEKGMSLSGGQRQRLSLARALLTEPEILLLDDCTSALDARTEERIQETLARTLTGKTAVIVSQRVSMARRCHQICSLEDGRITEQGTHADLVEAGGFYSRLYQQQTE